MIETIFNVTTILFGSMIALGIGASTLAISSFLTALADGNIDVSERRMLGVIYIVLRVAMVGILLTTIALAYVDPLFFGTFKYQLAVTLGVLYANAILMTKHLISPKIGPALQAATWYTMGFMVSIFTFGLYTITWPLFFGLYLVDFAVAVFVVNGFLMLLKKKRSATQ